jgi:[acyl-carrier-protein] S-malonyltransferase
VIAGERGAVEAAGSALAEAGAKRVVPLEVSAPFHCQLMAPAQEGLAPELRGVSFRAFRIPVISNVIAEPYRDPDAARELLRQQVCAPVRWVDCVRRLVREGVRVQLEVGPGNVLTGLAARIDQKLARARISQTGEVAEALAKVEEALA